MVEDFAVMNYLWFMVCPYRTSGAGVNISLGSDKVYQI